MSYEFKITLVHFDSIKFRNVITASFVFVAPLPIANISSNFEIIGHQLYNIDVMWGLPKYLPAYYTVSLNDFSIGNFKSKNVTGVSIWHTSIGMQFQKILKIERKSIV